MYISSFGHTLSSWFSSVFGNGWLCSVAHPYTYTVCIVGIQDMRISISGETMQQMLQPSVRTLTAQLGALVYYVSLVNTCTVASQAFR